MQTGLATSIARSEGSPRSNRPGVVPGISQNRSSQTLTVPIPAGGSIVVNQAGQEFYLVLATGKVRIKPSNGSENTYTQGTGEIVNSENCFANLQVRNPNAFPVVISIFVGFGDYIDNRAILYDPLVNQVVFPTFPVLAGSNACVFTDKSGTAFTDANGTEWLALTRLGIYVTNYDLALTYNIKNAAQTQTVLGVIPQTSIVFPVNGNFRIDDAANLQIVASEVYDAVLPGSF